MYGPQSMGTKRCTDDAEVVPPGESYRKGEGPPPRGPQSMSTKRSADDAEVVPPVKAEVVPPDRAKGLRKRRRHD